jgi:hypothetical protein
MSLNGVQAHVKGILDGLVFPGDLGKLTAFITPPSPDYVDQPVIYLWGSTQEESRQTMPRGRGFKKIQHELDGWLLWFGQADDVDADSQFPRVIDAVNKRMRAAVMPVPLTDPDTADPFTILSIGERIRTDYAPVHALEDQRWYAYNAHFIFSITELVQA